MDENSSLKLTNTPPFPSSNSQVQSKENNSDSERFGSTSEKNGGLSEITHKLSESNTQFFGKQTMSSEKTEEHTLTVRETAKIFEDSGVPRTERSIINWCNQNSQGECRLDCYYNNSEHKYYITPISIHRVIQEEKAKARNDLAYLTELSESRQEFSESFGNENLNFPKPSEQKSDASETIPRASERPQNEARQNIINEYPNYEDEEKNKRISELEEQLSKLREEKIRAESSTGYKDELLTFFKNQIANDREDYNTRMKFMQEQIIKLQEQSNKYVDQAIDSQRRIGSLEAHLRQLEAPKSDRRNEDIKSAEIRYRATDPEYQPPQAQNFSEPRTAEGSGNPPKSFNQEQGEELLTNPKNYEDNNERFSIRTDSEEQNRFSGQDDFPRQS